MALKQGDYASLLARVSIPNGRTGGKWARGVELSHIWGSIGREKRSEV